MILRHIPPGDGALSNTEPHDEFLELCALSTSGQLTSEEQGRLRKHVALCSSCREALEQYEALIGHALPVIGAKEEPEQVEPQPGWSIAKAEAALFERIAREEQASEEQGRDRPPLEPHSAAPHPASQTFPFAGASTWRRFGLATPPKSCSRSRSASARIWSACGVAYDTGTNLGSKSPRTHAAAAGARSHH